jgi:uncharacterized OB-fold protein
MSKLPKRRPETLGGYIVHGVPFPKEIDSETLTSLKQMTPLQIEQDYKITYLHSYGQDSPWFAAVSNKRLLATRHPERGYTYGTPHGHDICSGQETEWIDITDRPAHIHAFTVCHFDSEEFLPETPFVHVLVAFEGIDTLFLSRLMGIDPEAASLDWIGMQIELRFLRNSKLKPTDVYFIPKE